ncbi:LOW QUALITY PROTEIN: hypothetical protein QC761_302790 [Podospora bellae-mahoneyi]|uniref:Uncharacterized protein n=1 Tax=Podospora bellae-mahoneyi TaxID=2093777 RepID=A0ABR0FLL1_9PEZI|nr:LOW QUALITY PROTEIN: hypothetical protein QC761_302790 [Podospora bellae-mahoneyi]
MESNNSTLRLARQMAGGCLVVHRAAQRVCPLLSHEDVRAVRETRLEALNEDGEKIVSWATARGHWPILDFLVAPPSSQILLHTYPLFISVTFCFVLPCCVLGHGWLCACTWTILSKISNYPKRHSVSANLWTKTGPHGRSLLHHHTTIAIRPDTKMMPSTPFLPPNGAGDEKAHFHRLMLLVHSSLWLSTVAVIVLTSSLKTWTTNAHYLTFSLLVASPPFLLPLFFPFRPGPAAIDNAPSSGPSFHHYTSSYAIKFNVYIALLVFFGTYFGTAYFFQLMSMRYTFPGFLPTFDSDVLRREVTHTVPAFLYPLTHAYFISYYSLLLVLYEYISPRRPLARLGTVLALSYMLAFAETWFMASDLMTEWFAYGDRSKMLKVGSWGYASYFLAGLPMLRRLDPRWGWERVVIEAGACCYGVMVLLEIWGKVTGGV